MATLESRLSTLEARSKNKAADLSKAMREDAMGRLLDALRLAVPTIYPINVPDNTRAFVEQTIDFERHIYRIADGLAAGTLNAADTATLASLSACDLEAANITRERLIESLASIHRYLSE
ncbi:MAG: hypothetical protein GZ090_05075 [Oxalobacteraceae bacterium]|nr:hypothetical protein [Oxalobacteraceae bacterium]